MAEDLRAGFDVGSGKTKMMVVKVKANLIVTTLYSKQVCLSKTAITSAAHGGQIDVQYSHDLALSTDNTLSSNILSKGEAALLELKVG